MQMDAKRADAPMDEDVEIDDSLYSRQRYVLGDAAMQRMAKSNVLLIGMGAVGVEVAKDVALAGVRSLTIIDDAACTTRDLGCQFYVGHDDVTAGRSRAAASVPKIAELNPYVLVRADSRALHPSADLSFLTEFTCVIATECSLALQLAINAFCRSQTPPIAFVSADVIGIAGRIFCDFGAEFVVHDPDDTTPKDHLIANITKDSDGLVTCVEGDRHNLEVGDQIEFKDMKGMRELNGCVRTVTKLVGNEQFCIGDTHSLSDYSPGGQFTRKKQPVRVTFETLEAQLRSPRCEVVDLAKFDGPMQLHVCFVALDRFHQAHGRLPTPHDNTDADAFIQSCQGVSKEFLVDPLEKVDDVLARAFAFASQGCFAPLCGVIGGIAAQEVLKAVTGKFKPLTQFFYMDVLEVVKDLDDPADQFQRMGDRYDDLRICIGATQLHRLQSVKLFMVGCGAIGCELLKEYALLGVGAAPGAHIFVTDNDLIEKSNLNRQFLFRSHHIQQPKSVVAAEEALRINGALQITAFQDRVGPETELVRYTDSFFLKLDIAVNALDNLEARRYMDGRCVTNQRPLLESGTMGTQGHVQVIVPFITESYTSQSDPPETDSIPLCTLKSFPSQIEHCAEWALDKFRTIFCEKPKLFNNFWQRHSSAQQVAGLIRDLQNNVAVPDVVPVVRMLAHRPTSWSECVALSRRKFERFFNHKAKNMLHAFPPGHRTETGELFWTPPKRMPNAIEFDIGHPTHLQFLRATARLLADIFDVPWTKADLAADRLAALLAHIVVEPFVPSSRRIIVDPKATQNDDAASYNDAHLVEAAHTLTLKDPANHPALLKKMLSLDFEKDDDSNSHIDFIVSAANLRAVMYEIETQDRLKIKRIAGRIVPAIATTTAAVSGLVGVELVKLVRRGALETYRNTFMNLALPSVLLAEPGPVKRSKITNDRGEEVTLTLWDRWEVRGAPDTTLRQFMQLFEDKYGIKADSVVHGSQIVYFSFIPSYKQRLDQPMAALVKHQQQPYVELGVACDDDEKQDWPIPPVRYYFQ